MTCTRWTKCRCHCSSWATVVVRYPIFRPSTSSTTSRTTCHSKTWTHCVRCIASIARHFSMPFATWISVRLRRCGVTFGGRRTTTTATNAKRKNIWANTNCTVCVSAKRFRILCAKSTMHSIRIWLMYWFRMYCDRYRAHWRRQFAILPKIWKIGWHRPWPGVRSKLYAWKFRPYRHSVKHCAVIRRWIIWRRPLVPYCKTARKSHKCSTIWIALIFTMFRWVSHSLLYNKIDVNFYW